MNQFRAGHRAGCEQDDPFMRVVGGLGMALFICGIFIPEAHSLMMVGLALYVISWVI